MESILQHFDVAVQLTDSDECDSSNETDVDTDELDDCKLDITQALADSNYDAAGIEVNEEMDRISIDKHKNLICSEVNSILDDIVTELKMPYWPSDMQRVSVNALGQLKNVVLVSPTGSGKMNIPQLATLVLRKKLDIPKGKHSYFSRTLFF